MMTRYCANCNSDTGCTVETRSEAYPVRGEDITIEASVVVCKRCGQDVFDLVYDDENLKKVYALYRSKHGITGPDEIKAIREQYGLSQRGLSRLLGWGEITVHRYEAGGVPSGAQNALLKMIATSEGMSEYLERQGEAVPKEERQIVEAVLSKRPRPSASVADTFAKVHESMGPSILTGYRKFDSERLRQMIRFFSSGNALFKTKLNKLVWYADFVAFRRNTVSISGMGYIRLQHGPVPKYYGMMYDALEENNTIEVVDDPWSGGELVSTKEGADLSVFSPEEREILKFIKEKFANDTSGSISDKSHKEAAWIDTVQGNLISYDYANQLSID